MRPSSRMVIVGHSMGGLLTKMMAVDAGDHLWELISDRPFGELRARGKISNSSATGCSSRLGRRSAG